MLRPQVKYNVTLQYKVIFVAYLNVYTLHVINQFTTYHFKREF